MKYKEPLELLEKIYFLVAFKNLRYKLFNKYYHLFYLCLELDNK